MISCSRLAILRSGSDKAAIASNTAFSASAASACAFSSLVRAFMAARSSAVNPVDDLLLVVVDFVWFIIYSSRSYCSIRVTNAANAK